MSDPGRLTPFERAYDALEGELANAVTDAERKNIRDAMRDMEREESERERWENEGEDRGWL
jgi:hypothetical protein